MALSHPPAAARAGMPAIRAELFLFVGLLDLRRFHGLREGQRQRVPVIRARLAAFLHVGQLSSTEHCISKYTLSRLHPYPSPVSGD